MTDSPYIKANSITKAFGGETVLEDLSFEFNEPGIYIVEGDSGTGKTTLLRIIAGLETCDKGTVEKRGRIGYVFQEPRLFENVTLLENVRLVGEKKNSGGPGAGELLEAVGLGDAKQKTAAESSGGMRQRASICRAIYYRPDILLCDEPFSAVDETNAKLAADLISRFAETGICIVATHGGETPFERLRSVISL